MNLSLNWLVVLFLLCFSFSSFWLCLGSYSFFVNYLLNSLLSQFIVFFKLKVLKGLVGFFVVLFVYLLSVNLLGLVPYVFSVSAHFLFCLSFSFPFWFAMMIMGWVNLTNQMFSHLIPVGTPFGLISFMVLIESISQLIRPWSLAIRMTANMISGHLLMSLLGDCWHFLAWCLQPGLFIFEFAVCFIQAYVFCALMVLYYGEV